MILKLSNSIKSFHSNLFKHHDISKKKKIVKKNQILQFDFLRK